MRSVLIGAVESSAVALEEMQRACMPPALLATLDPKLGPKRHADYVDLARRCDADTRVVYPGNINDADFLELVSSVEPDVIFVIGWSQLVGEELRSLARRYVIGFHPTPLPILRGRAPIAWTILSGMRSSGTTLFVIDDGIDTGAVLDQDLYDLSPRETVLSLIERIKISLRDMLRRSLPAIADGSVQAVPQSSKGISYGARRTTADGLIDWSLTATEIDRFVRGQGRPYGGAFTYSEHSKVVIWEAAPLVDGPQCFAVQGQICFYDDGAPVILCGNSSLLRVGNYEVIGKPPGFRYSGQPRFRHCPLEARP